MSLKQHIKRYSLLNVYIRNLIVLYTLSFIVMFSVFFYLKYNIKKYFYEDQNILVLGAFNPHERLIESAMLEDKKETINAIKNDVTVIPFAINKDFIKIDTSNINIGSIVSCKADLQTYEWGFVCRKDNLATYYIQIQTTTNLIGFAKIQINENFYQWGPFKTLFWGIIFFWISYTLVLATMIFRFLKNVYKPTLKAINDLKTASTLLDFDQIIEVLTFKEIYDLASILSQQAQYAAIGKTTQLIAHDIRGPFAKLKIILSMLETFRTNQDNLTSAKKDVELAIKKVESMLSEIMGSTQIFSFKFEPCSIYEIIDAAIKQTHVLNSLNKINISFCLEHTHMVYGDKEKLVRCLVNILENAVEALSKLETKNCLNVTIESKEQLDEDYVTLIISNNGKLLDEVDIPKLFESFFTKGKTSGTGLGLASAKRIVTLHKGTIVANNNYSKHEVMFTLKIPSSKNMDSKKRELINHFAHPEMTL